MLISIPVGLFEYELLIWSFVTGLIGTDLYIWSFYDKKEDMTFEVGLELASNGHLSPTVPLKWDNLRINQYE